MDEDTSIRGSSSVYVKQCHNVQNFELFKFNILNCFLAPAFTIFSTLFLLNFLILVTIYIYIYGFFCVCVA